MRDAVVTTPDAAGRYHRPVAMTSDDGAAVALFHSLADPSRLAIVQQLRGGELRVRDLHETLGLAQSTVSQHVACLRECGLVTGRVEGRQVFYSLSRPELLDLLEAAQELLAATGYQVDLCRTYGSATAGSVEVRKRAVRS